MASRHVQRAQGAQIYRRTPQVSVASVASYQPPQATKAAAPPPPPKQDNDGDEATETAATKAAEFAPKSFGAGQGQNVNMMA